MYATDLRDQLFAAALPLKPLVAWCGSACSVTVAVPPAPAIEGLAISSVRIELSLPSGEVISAPAVPTAGTPLWTATFAAGNFATAGSTTQGFTVYLGGKDETGADRVWIVAKGDLEIRAGDAAPSPGGSYYLVKLRDSAPANPVAGDAYISGGKLHIYSGTAWTTIGGAAPSDDPPLMDGEASAGVSDVYARGDHRHPSDTSKLDGAAAYREWKADRQYTIYSAVSYAGKLYRAKEDPLYGVEPTAQGSGWAETTLDALKQNALSSEQLMAVNSGVTDEKVATWDGYAAQIAQKANASDLPYSIVSAEQTGDWQFSGGVEGLEVDEDSVSYDGANATFYCFATYTGSIFRGYSSTGYDEDASSVVFSFNLGLSDLVEVTATRAYALADHTVNAVSLSSSGTIQLPATAGADKSRDFYVKLALSSGVTVSFVAASGESAPAFIPASPSLTSGVWHFTEVAAGVYSITECGVDYAAILGDIETALHAINNGSST